MQWKLEAEKTKRFVEAIKILRDLGAPMGPAIFGLEVLPALEDVDGDSEPGSD